MLNPLIFSFPRQHWHGCTQGSHGDSLFEAHHVICASPGVCIGVAPCAGEELVWVPVLPLTPKNGWPWAILLLSLPCPRSMNLATPESQREKGYTPTRTSQPRAPTKKSLKVEHSGLPLHHPGVNLSGDSQGSASPHRPGGVDRVLHPEGGTRHGAWAGCRDTATSLQDPARGTRS